ncbi:MAG: type I methionyl aminopeptidase [Acidimicrobiia bacterium]|nr:type I methionyl aminopeptidase [Acidimicrobiia bacterium]
MAKRKRRPPRVRTDVPVSDPPVRLGLVSPMRTVPATIARPPYVTLPGGEPGPSVSSPIRTADELARMRKAGAVGAEILLEVGREVAPGVSTEKLDQIAHEAHVVRGAYPSPLGYRGYPKSVCTSVNEVICHGIPDSRQLQDGDIVNIDVTAYIDGVHGDTSVTLLVGDVDDHSRTLVRETRRALELAIDEVGPGVPFNAIGRAIETHARRFDLGVVRDFIGHGVGTEFHTSLQIPHYYERTFTLPMQEGMSFTIEPMLTLGEIGVHIWDDAWTAVTSDGRRTAQFEHTMVVAADGVEVLTRTSGGSCAHEELAEALA